jgi:hypothetical protein
MAQVSQRRTVHGLDTVFRGGLLRTQVVGKGLLSTQVNYWRLHRAHVSYRQTA